MEEEIEAEGIRIVENKLGDYDCPESVMSALEERSIAKPWEQGVIVKNLEKGICYKALENRL